MPRSRLLPPGALNPGNQSISGQREDANGFMVNGGDVKELMNGGTSIVPNLDSIAEFRILTNNFDAQYGNYSGGIINVVTKSGANQIHGSGFEFLRNTDLDARNFFSPDRSFYRQNQFGGTVGGPIKRDKVFYFADYQGTRTNQGIDTGLISVPTLAERSGNFQGVSNALTGSRERALPGESAVAEAGLWRFRERAVLHAGCSSSAQCVFPNAIIPQQAWSSPAQHLLQYIPLPNDRTVHVFHRLGRRDGARRQRQFPHRRQRGTFGSALGILFFRRLHREQSLSRRARAARAFLASTR